jgi:AcrR family transcriptional regulator
MGSDVSEPDTKTRLMDVAEGLFAEKGYAATSLRDITSEAGANLAAVNYHFQSKEGLLSAIFERYVGPVNRERLETLDAIEARAGKGPPDLEELLRAFLAPAFARRSDRGVHGARFMRLAGRMHSETGEHLRSLFLDHFREVARRFGEAFLRALPHLDEYEVHLRTHFMVGAMAHTLLWSENMPGPPFGRRKTLPPGEALEGLLRFAAAGLGAPAPRGKQGSHKETKR